MVTEPHILISGGTDRADYIIPDRRTTRQCPLCRGRGHTLPFRTTCLKCDGRKTIPYVPLPS